MQSIGERLEEARKRKGISLREAAEATKIRSDFLGYIELNKMDFDLPEIYKRGFLKNYARYLKLDVDKIMTDYNAQQLSNSRMGKKGGNEWFGQMEIKKSEEEEAAEQAEASDSASYGRIAAKPTQANEDSETADDEEADKTFYMKIGLIFVGTLALVFVVFGLIWAVLGSGGSDEVDDSPELRDSTEITDSAGITPTTPIADENSITLVASGTVYVLIKQQADNKELYRNTMSEGDTVTLEKDGAVDILFTAGENILIEHNGERLRPSTSGTAKITLE